MTILMIRITDAISGAETYNLSLIRGLKTIFPDEKILYLTNHEAFAKRVRKLKVFAAVVDVPVKEIGTKKDFLKAVIVLPKYLYVLYKAIASLSLPKKDSVIFFQSMTEKLFLTLPLKFMKYQVGWIEHGPLFVTRRAWIIKKLYLLMSNYADKIVCVSQDTLKDLEESGVTKDKLQLVRTGVDTNYFTAFSDEAILKQKNAVKLVGAQIIGYVGSITKDKGLDSFIDISEYLLEKNVSLRFLWVGNGPFLEEAKKRVKQLGIENYYLFIPFIEDIRPYLGIMDIFFFPTVHNEGLSMALLEAASMEKVIVAHDIGGNKELIHNEETGYLYAHKSDEAVAKLLQKVLTNEKINLGIQKAARAKVENRFNMEHMAIQYQSVFTTLCKN